MRLIGTKIKPTLRLPREKRALICTSATGGSLGAEAMVQVLVDQLSERGYTVDLVATSKDKDHDAIKGVSDWVEIGYYEQDLHYMVEKLSKYKAFYLVGADVLDGYYDELPAQWLLWVAWVAAKCCPKVTITGFSFNKKPTRGCIVKLPF